MSLFMAWSASDAVNHMKQARSFEAYKRLLWENDDYMKMDDEIRSITLLKIIPIHREALCDATKRKDYKGEWFRVTEVLNNVPETLTQKHELIIKNAQPLGREPSVEDWDAWIQTYLFSN